MSFIQLFFAACGCVMVAIVLYGQCARLVGEGAYVHSGLFCRLLGMVSGTCAIWLFLSAFTTAMGG